MVRLLLFVISITPPERFNPKDVPRKRLTVIDRMGGLSVCLTIICSGFNRSRPGIYDVSFCHHEFRGVGTATLVTTDVVFFRRFGLIASLQRLANFSLALPLVLVSGLFVTPSSIVCHHVKVGRNRNNPWPDSHPSHSHTTVRNATNHRRLVHVVQPNSLTANYSGGWCRFSLPTITSSCPR